MNRKIVEYRTVYETRDSAFDDAINALIADGWQPLGGVAFDVDGDSYTAGDYDTHVGGINISCTPCQAMVRYEEVEG